MTRWMIEPSSGVFVGDTSALVRDKLWQKVCQNAAGGACVLIHSAANEQGYACRFWGATRRLLEDFEGLTLVRLP